MRLITVLLGLLAGCCVVAVSSAGASFGDSGRPTGQLRDCGSRGEGRSPQKLPTPPGVRIGPLVLWPSVRTSVSATGDPTWPFLVKAPVVLPARTKVVLAIAPAALSRAAFQSHEHGFTSAVRFEACREREPAYAYRGTVGKLTGFPFAIALAKSPACIPMELWIDGRPAPIRRLVPFGRRSC